MSSSLSEEPVNHWFKSVDRIVSALNDLDVALIIVVGLEKQARRWFTAQLVTRLPEELEVRNFRFSPENLNPFIDAQRGVDRGEYVTVASGLSELNPRERDMAFFLMNQNRGLLNRGVRLIVWVEPAQKIDFDYYAGDFADWAVLTIELPDGDPPSALETALSAGPVRRGSKIFEYMKHFSPEEFEQLLYSFEEEVDEPVRVSLPGLEASPVERMSALIQFCDRGLMLDIFATFLTTWRHTTPFLRYKEPLRSLSTMSPDKFEQFLIFLEEDWGRPIRIFLPGPAATVILRMHALVAYSKRHTSRDRLRKAITKFST